jgi:hypothetical protein
MTLRLINRILPNLTLAAVTLAGCDTYAWLPGGGRTAGAGVDAAVGDVVSSANGFSEVLIQGRTFVNGNSVKTVTYGVTDKTRTPVGIDFNGDAKIDPVVVYSPGTNGGVFQILLSKGPLGQVDFSYLTLDGNDRWSKLFDVAVGDIDGDGAWDLVGASGDGVVYLHNPGPGRVTVLREWGSNNPDLEFLSGSTTSLTKDELEALLQDLLPAGTSLADYEVAITQGYNRVAIGDFDNDNDNDIVATRRLNINLTPRPGSNLPPVELITGEMQLFLNPGGAKDGSNWQLVTIGQHERYVELDRQNATAVIPFDMDGDGDLDLVSAARDDINAQIAWFENPGAGAIGETGRWTQWRIGSVRDAFSVDIADLTGDGRADVVAVGAKQQQIILFQQPAEGPRRDYDWDSSVLVTFESFFPLDIRALDIDNDGRLELVVGGTNGALRYFESPGDPHGTWEGHDIVTFDPPGEVSLLGFGDLDADGDLDVVAAINDTTTENDTADRVTWIRNDAP